MCLPTITVRQHRAAPLRVFQLLRGYHDYLRLSAGAHTVRLPLNSPKIIGSVTTRGTRTHQEDRFRVCCIHINPAELYATWSRSAPLKWDYSSLPGELAGQVLYAGLFDGHGGSAVSDFLHDELHSLLETADKDSIKDIYSWLKSHGGYFKRFRGGLLQPWVENPDTDTGLDMDARSTLAFLKADKLIAEMIPKAKRVGSTATVALLHSLDVPSSPVLSAERVALRIAHCGDTRALICAARGGLAHRLTEKHHAEARHESARLRRLGAVGSITDSFGETRWMGAVENTRGLGDTAFKRFGVTAEPEMTHRILHGPDWAFLVMVTDGVSSVLSDQEIVDVARYGDSPERAAYDIVNFAEELGAEDNSSALVIPLAGFGKITGVDQTKNLRVWRQNEHIGTERQRRM